MVLRAHAGHAAVGRDVKQGGGGLRAEAEARPARRLALLPALRLVGGVSDGPSLPLGSPSMPPPHTMSQDLQF